MESCSKVLGNVDILALIFEHLDFKDQLRLAQVNKQLNNAYGILFHNKFDFSSVYLNRWVPSYGGFQSKTIIANKIGINGKCLEDIQVFKDFLRIYADRVRYLTLDVKGPLDKSCFNAFLGAFCKLQSLSTYGMNFSADNLRSCPVDIEQIKLINPCMDAGGLVKYIGDNLKNLHKLKIEYGGDFCGIEHRSFIKMCLLPKLEILRFKPCFFSGQIDGYLQLSSACNLKQLEICLWKVEYLKCMPVQNLKILRLSSKYCTNNLFSILTDTCLNLEILILHRIEFGIEYANTLPPKLIELRFYGCHGLKHSCLKKLLTEFKIIKFCTRQTVYDGEFQDFRISPHIQSLEYDFVKMVKFKSAYENNTNLKELIYNHMYFECDASMQDMSFNSILHLESLDIPFIPTLGAIAQLKSLRKLTVRPFHSPNQSWKITDLLNHTSLHELSIQNVFFSFENLKQLEMRQPPGMSNITRLSVTPMILANMMDFWLELFTLNKGMRLVCWPIWNETDLGCAYLLVNNKKFPLQLKYIDICCLIIDPAELRRNSERHDQLSGIRLPQQIGLNADLPLVLVPNIVKRYRIILSWDYDYNF